MNTDYQDIDTIENKYLRRSVQTITRTSRNQKENNQSRKHEGTKTRKRDENNVQHKVIKPPTLIFSEFLQFSKEQFTTLNMLFFRAD